MGEKFYKTFPHPNKQMKHRYKILSISVIAIILFQGWVTRLVIRHETQKLEDFIIQHLTGTETTPNSNSLTAISKTHDTHITTAETDAGIQLSKLASLLIKEEGSRNAPYTDTTGAPTIGVGRNLRGNGISITELQTINRNIPHAVLLSETHIQNGRIHIQTLAVAQRVFPKPLTHKDIELLLVHDLNRTITEAKSVFGQQGWNNISENRKLAILDMLFNLGLTHFREFHKFINDIKESNYNAAANELLLSQAARENILRYHRISLVIQTNQWRTE